MRTVRFATASTLALIGLIGVVSLPATAAPLQLDEARGVITLAPMLAQVTPAVVNISVRSRLEIPRNPLFEDPFFRRFFDVPRRPRAALSAGSGVIVDAGRGYVLTNHHVVGSASQIQVTLKDQRSFEATLVGSDPETDIALLRIDADGLTELAFGDSDRLEVGDLVLAIGNPFGIGQTVTSGIVSALGRSGLGLRGYEDFIQTDASINPGNSGGALVNSKGELVGINSAIIGPNHANVGIGFAVPSNMARAVMDQLIAHGEVRRGRLGVEIQDLTPDLAAALDLERTSGALITRVEPNSPAEQAGLRPGDVVVQLNRHGVRNATHLTNLVGLVPVGEAIEIAYYRDGRLRHTEASVRGVQQAAVSVARSAPQLTGASFRDPGASARQGIRGVLVAEVERGSPAWRYGLREGDVVTDVNRRPVASVEEMMSALDGSQRGFVLHLIRGNARMVLVVQ